jgi:hypothetical protein
MKQKPLLLSNASSQEIQLELINRTEFNFFYGRKIATDLTANRKLWEAVLIDREYPYLLKVRDLSGNVWNVDTLYILAHDAECVIKLLELGQGWSFDEVRVFTETETSEALGSTSIGSKRLISMRWD